MCRARSRRQQKLHKRYWATLGCEGTLWRTAFCSWAKYSITRRECSTRTDAHCTLSGIASRPLATLAKFTLAISRQHAPPTASCVLEVSLCATSPRAMFQMWQTYDSSSRGLDKAPTTASSDQDFMHSSVAELRWALVEVVAGAAIR